MSLLALNVYEVYVLSEKLIEGERERNNRF